MPLKNLEYWILAQMALEGVLVLLLIFCLVKIRSMSQVLHTFREAKESIAAEMTRLAEQVASLETRRAVLEETLGQVRGKTPNSRGAAYAVGAHSPSSPPPAPAAKGIPLRSQVADLHLQGYSPAEIAHRLGLHPTEVKMALDLTRLKGE